MTALFIRTVILLAIVASFSTAPVTASAPAAVKPSRCGPAKGKTLVADRRGRVYTLSNHTSGPKTQSTYGCLFTTGHSWRLGRAHGFASLDSETLVLRSPWVAYSETISGEDSSASTILVKSLRTGHVSHTYPAVTQRSGVESATRVAHIALKGNGSVAWIGEETSIPPGPGSLRLRQVDIADSAGFSVVDQGDGIDPHSLKLHGLRLSWKDSGVTRSAVLR